MTAQEQYQAEHAEFVNKYGIPEFSVDHHESFRKTIRGFDEFSFGKTYDNSPFGHYVDTLSAALKKYLENKTKMEKGKEYDMSDISIGDFIEGFENVMQKKHVAELKDGEAPTRNAFDGATYRNVAEAVLSKIGEYNKPLSNVWADNIVGNKASVDQLKSFAFNSITKLASVQKIEDLDANDEKQLQNVVMAKEAMENLREKRGRWWRIRHPFLNSDEKKFLKTLSGRIDTYRNRGLPVDFKSPKIVDGTTLAKLKNSIKQFEGGKTNHLNGLLANEKKADDLANDKSVYAEVTGQIAALTKNAKVSVKGFQPFIHDQIYKRGIEETKKMWSSIQGKSSSAINTELEKGAKEVFFGIFLTMHEMTMDPEDKLVAAQRITDIMINKFSPVAFDEKYAQYGKNHFINNTDLDVIKGIATLFDDKDARDALTSAKRELNAEKLDLNSTFGEKSRNDVKVPKVEEIKNPSLYNTNVK